MQKESADNMSRIIAITNQKGGIGKTTTAIAIASIPHSQGHRVLLIDADAQGNASDTFGAEIDKEVTLYDVLLEYERVNINEAIQHTKYGDIVAGDPLLRRADALLASDMAGAFRLKDALKDLDGYEYIIIDTAPALGELTKNALIAANEVIVPASADRYSIQGLSSIVQSVNAIQRSQLNPELKIAGIVLVAYPVTTNLGAEIQEELRAARIRSGVRHRDRAAEVIARFVAVAFALNAVSRPAGTGSRRVAPLSHEEGQHTVERNVRIESGLDEREEVVRRDRRFVLEEFEGYVALRRAE